MKLKFMYVQVSKEKWILLRQCDGVNNPIMYGCTPIYSAEQVVPTEMFKMKMQLNK